jgi:hypothetical protein
MEILEAYDLSGSLRAAAELAGCSHHTVAHVAAREAGGRVEQPAARPQLIDEFLPKVEEWVQRSGGSRAARSPKGLALAAFESESGGVLRFARPLLRTSSTPRGHR